MSCTYDDLAIPLIRLRKLEVVLGEKLSKGLLSPSIPGQNRGVGEDGQGLPNLVESFRDQVIQWCSIFCQNFCRHTVF